MSICFDLCNGDRTHGRPEVVISCAVLVAETRLVARPANHISAPT